MMRSFLISCLAGTVLMVGGCGSPSDAPPSEAQQATRAKQIVVDFTAQARKKPAQAPQQLNVLLEALDAYAANHGGPYVQLRDTAKELQTLYTNKADKADIEKKLAELEQQANTLPGA